MIWNGYDIASHQSPVTSYESPVTSHQSPVTNKKTAAPQHIVVKVAACGYHIPEDRAKMPKLPKTDQPVWVVKPP